MAFVIPFLALVLQSHTSFHTYLLSMYTFIHFFINLPFQLTCRVVTYYYMVDKCAYQLFAPLSPWDYVWGKQGIWLSLNKRHAPRRPFNCRFVVSEWVAIQFQWASFINSWTSPFPLNVSEKSNSHINPYQEWWLGGDLITWFTCPNGRVFDHLFGHIPTLPYQCPRRIVGLTINRCINTSCLKY